MFDSRVTRRAALKQAAAAAFAPAVFRRHALAAPSETVYHASFGGSGMALSDVQSLAASPHFKLVAVADGFARNRVKRTDFLFRPLRA